MSIEETQTYLVAARRTPVGSFLGALSSLTAPQLGSIAIRAALESARVSATDVDEVYMGNVLSAGVGQAPARQASLGAEIPHSVPTTTVNKVCGSGLQTVILAHRAIRLGDAHVIVAGGMESMSQAPYYLPNARTGLRIGDSQVIDGMMYDGLTDPYDGVPMGKAAEVCASENDCTREAQDAFAAESYQRALSAQAAGAFKDEIAPVSVPQRKGDPLIVDTDEEPGRGQPEKFGKLRPAFDKAGTITAANASSINDGAAAVVLASGAAVKKFDLTPLARIVSTGAAAQEPVRFTTAPVKAIDAALSRASFSKDDIDLWEINEAFSCMAMACAKLTGVDLAKVNVHGGAVALGHPIGASGTRVLTTLVHAMRKHDKKRGLATLCIGGGEAVATIIERV